MSYALLLMDFSNDLVDPKGKLASKGYVKFARENQLFHHVNQAIAAIRSQGGFIVWVNLAFHPCYLNHPNHSPLLGGAAALNAFQQDQWGSQIQAELALEATDLQLTKTRVSPFFGTPLESVLRLQGIDHLLLAGVATELVVSCAAREGHDRDFAITVLSNCCGDVDEQSHQRALVGLQRFGQVMTLNQLGFEEN
ncbi:MAG: isochorismatase family cysteine hydrolase [Ferrimonas sp.]